MNIYSCLKHEVFLLSFLWHIYLLCRIITLFHYSSTFGVSDPSACAVYKMEVLRDAESQIRPLFRVTLETGEQVGSMMMHLLRFSCTNSHFLLHMFNDSICCLLKKVLLQSSQMGTPIPYHDIRYQ